MNVRNPDITGPCLHLKTGARIRAQNPHEHIKNITTHPALTGEGGNSKTYSPYKSNPMREKPRDLVIAAPESKDFVYSMALFTHLLATEASSYLKETYRILKADGVMWITFFCIEHVELGHRWTFQHRRGNAYIENAKYPEAAVAYHEAFLPELAIDCGFRNVAVTSRGISSGENQTEDSGPNG
jgi:predicted SAM-dependent methyltransferase